MTVGRRRRPIDNGRLFIERRWVTGATRPTRFSWRSEIFAHVATGATNGPRGGLNLYVKRLNRCGHGFKRFDHYRLRVLLHAGGVAWSSRPWPLRIRTRSPHSSA